MKTTIAIIVVIILAAVGWWYYGYQASPIDDSQLLPVSAVEVDNNKTTEIEQDLEGLDLGDLEAEFNDIDSQLENL